MKLPHVYIQTEAGVLCRYCLATNIEVVKFSLNDHCSARVEKPKEETK